MGEALRSKKKKKKRRTLNSMFPLKIEKPLRYIKINLKKKFFFRFIEVSLIYRAVAISAVQQSDSVIHGYY